MGAFAAGAVGGALAELLRWYRVRETPPDQLPPQLKNWFYWLMTALMIVAGGVLAVLYDSEDHIGPLLAANVGASAPLAISALTKTAPGIPPPANDH